MLLDAILQMHAWASGRFKHKTQLEGQKLENQNLRIIKTEAEQGMCSPTPSSSTSAFSFFVLCFQVPLRRYWNRWYATFTVTFQVLSWIYDVLLAFSNSFWITFLIVLCGSAKSGLRDKCWLSIILAILEKAREGLADFVTMMKKALAALTGVAWYPTFRSLMLGLLNDSYNSNAMLY